MTDKPSIPKQYECCYQFDDDKPRVFLHTTGNLVITMTPGDPLSDSNIVFRDGNKTLKIFLRELKP